MSGTDDKGGADLDFDWDDALADWERDLDDKSEAVSGPMPQKPAVQPPKEPARALYRPPDPSEFKRPQPRGAAQTPPRVPTPPRAPVPPPTEDVHLSFDDDDDDEHTRIASIPKELIASLVTAREREEASAEQHRLSTRPPPAATRPPPAASPGSAPAVDLDLDDMLDGLEQDTRAYPESVPRMVSPIRTARPSSIPAAARASEPPPGTRVTARPGAPSQPPQQPTLSAAPPPAVELTISSAPPPRASEPSTEGVDESSRPTPLPTSVVPTPAPPAAPLASPPVVPPPAASRPTPAPPGDGEPSEPASSAPEAPAAKPAAPALPGLPRPPAPPRVPAIPRPGAIAPPKIPLPRPSGALPPLPRPSAPGALPRVAVPSPSGARVPPPGAIAPRVPAIPRPNDPVVPRPPSSLARGGDDAPDAAAPPSVPAGPIAQPQATQQAQLSRESTPSAPPRLRSPLDDDDDFAFLDALGEPPAPAPAAPVAEAAAPVAEPEAPVAEAAAPVAEPEAPVAEAVVEPAARASELPVLMLDDEPPAPADDAALPPEVGAAAAADATPAASDDAPALETPAASADDGASALETSAASDASAPALETSVSDGEALVLETPAAASDDDALALDASAAPDDDEPEIEASAASDDDQPEIEASAASDDDQPEIEASAASDDDEPALETSASDDDEPALETSASDDDEPEIESAAATVTIDADDEEDAPVAAPGPAAAPVSPARDRGAAAARRTVRSRKPRVEVFPLVGRSAEALAARRELLARLAASRTGSARARLLLAAAELDHQLGRTDDARDATLAAREADPGDPVALRAVARDAVERGAHDEAAPLLEAEIALPVSAAERRLALLSLAELRLQHLGDAAGAERAASDALELAPRSVVAALTLAAARAASGAPVADALDRAAAGWGDARARAVLRTSAAREVERTGDRTRAAELYRAAREDDSSALDAALGAARTTTGPAQADALEAIGRATPEGALRDTLVRRAALALVTARAGEEPSDEATSARTERARRAVALLEGARTLAALRTRALAAGHTGDVDAEIAALEDWAGASGGTDRALALVRLAEAHGASGALEAADETLRAASLADAGLSTIRIVREVLARRAGDRGRLVEAVESAGALGAAAKLATDPRGAERERELLAEARREDEAPLCAEVVWLDASAAAGDSAEVLAALRQEADRSPPDQRIGALLALADQALQEGDREAAERALREARELAPGDPTVLRPLGRLAAAAGSPRDAAALWLEEATAASGPRAASAGTVAGLLLEAAEGDAIGAYRRALDAQPGYGPALWSLEPVARAAGDALTLVELHEQAADAAPTSVDAAASLVRAALLRAESEPAAASALLARAREKTPHDAVLVELVLRLGETLTPDERAQLTLSLAEGAPAGLARAIHLSAAASLEDAGEPGRAAELYRALAERHPGDPLIALPLDRAELHAGETARVAERRFAAVRDAEDDDLRVLALERLAELDLEERNDAASGVLSLVSILEVAPGHVPSLRTLERYYLEQDRREELAGVEERLALHLGTPADAAAHLRFAVRLRLAPADASGDVADSLLLSATSNVRVDGWIARRTRAAATAAGAKDVAATMAADVAARMPTPLSSASAAMRAAELAASAGDVARAVAALAPAVESAPDHTAAAELLAKLRESAGDARGAAEALGIAAKASQVPGRAASLWYRAGVLWQDSVGDEDRALEALTEASRIDVGHLDVFDRLRNLLELREDHAALSKLVARRTAAGGGDPALLVELHSLQAKLAEKLEDREGAREALRAVLALSPEKIDALRRLAELCLEDEDYRNAAEALIRIARIRKDRDELRWVFFTLGEIYDRHIPDAKRAEAAYRRVLKLAPDDVTAMERLAALFRRENQLQAAVEQLSELSRVEPDPDRARTHQLALAEVLEQMGDARRAEQVLETARRAAPTELVALKALADFYQRQRALPALAMHVNRAVADFRHALGTDLSDVAAWLGLVEVLGWRGRADAARVVASTAYALGISDLEISRLVDARGGVPGVGAAAADASLDDLLAPQGLPAALRAVMQAAGTVLEKALPFDPRAYRAEKLGPRDGAIRAAAVDIARTFGIPDVEIWIAPGAPRVCVPVSSGPPVSLMIGRDLLAVDDRERAFVLTRALKIASAGLSVAVRSQPQDLVLAMAALVHGFDPHYAPPGVDPAALADWSRRVARLMPRKLVEELGPVVFEMAGAPDYEPARLAMAASELGDRVALLAGGSVPAALNALLLLSGENGPAETTSARVAQLRRFPEVLALASFAVSDVHFEARHRAGADRT